jgi:hypothetical protein
MILALICALSQLYVHFDTFVIAFAACIYVVATFLLILLIIDPCTFKILGPFSLPTHNPPEGI